MTEFLDIEPTEQIELLQKIKDSSSFTWLEISKILNVSKGMVSFYKNGFSRIPRKSLEQLVVKTNIEIDLKNFKFRKIFNKQKQVIKPEISEEFCEFLGILAGDGCLSKNYSINITCDANSDKKYIKEKVAPLIENLFGLKPGINESNNAIYCRIYSKELFYFINKNFEFPIGLKKNILKVPEFIVRNTNFSKAFLRGVFDTDGGFHRHHKNSAQIEITSYSSFFLHQLFQMLINLGLNTKLGKKQVWILDRIEIDKFFELLKPNNFKHLYKYKKFKENKTVPLHREIDYSLL